MNSLDYLPSKVSNAIRSYSLFPNLSSIVQELVYNAIDSKSLKIEVGFDKILKHIVVKDYGKTLFLLMYTTLFANRNDNSV